MADNVTEPLLSRSIPLQTPKSVYSSNVLISSGKVHPHNLELDAFAPEFKCNHPKVDTDSADVAFCVSIVCMA